MSTRTRVKFRRREVALRRVEYVLRGPDPAAGDKDYDRYENDRLEVMGIIQRECGSTQPRDLRLVDSDEGMVISYEVQRVELH